MNPTDPSAITATFKNKQPTSTVNALMCYKWREQKINLKKNKNDKICKIIGAGRKKKKKVLLEK